MVTKSMDIQNEMLLNTIRKLGDNSKESYVIFDVKKIIIKYWNVMILFVR